MSMNIPDKAVEAAQQALLADARAKYGPKSDLTPMGEKYVRLVLDAAAPFIAAVTLEAVANKIGPYSLADPAITDPSTGEYVQGGSMAIMLNPDGEDASTVRGYLRALAAEVRP